jgi:hypothetical protein
MGHIVFNTATDQGRVVKYQAVVLNFDKQTVKYVDAKSAAPQTKAVAVASPSTPPRRIRQKSNLPRRLLEEDETLTIEEAALAASALVALGGRGHEEALSALSAIAQRAPRQRLARRGCLP